MGQQTVYISDLSVGDTFGKGWQLFRANVGPLIGIIIVLFLLAIPSNTGEDASAGQNLFASLYSIFVLNPVALVAYYGVVRLARGQELNPQGLFSVLQNNYLNVVGVTFLASMIIGIGFLLFIIPGVYLSARLGFAGYLCLDRGLGPIDAIKTSWDVTQGHAGTLILYGIVAFFLILVGLLALLVGALVAMPVALAAFAILYNTIESRSDYVSDAPAA